LKRSVTPNEQLSSDDSKLINSIKLTDDDIQPLLASLSENTTFSGGLIINEQDLTDKTSVIIASLLKKNVTNLLELSLSKN